ncbi:hypothetical protein CJ177_44495 [Rhodococcus sp. ACPA1]|nr:hypothetical protein CJ177_44495 [Rhodococcus sp. ACPA1]
MREISPAPGAVRHGQGHRLPAVTLWQHYGDVPQPRVYPHGSFTAGGRCLTAFRWRIRVLTGAVGTEYQPCRATR